MSEEKLLAPQPPAAPAAYHPPPAALPPPTAPLPPPNYAYGGYQPVPNNTNVTVITTQPAPAPTVYVQKTGDHFMILSIVMSFFCFFCGTWWALLCTIPAIIFAANAQSAEKRGDIAQMQSNHRMALILNIAAIVTYVVTWIIIIIIVAVQVAAAHAAIQNNIYYTYYT